MSSRTAPLAAALLLLAACAGPDGGATPAPARPEPPPEFVASRASLRALADYLYVGYTHRLARDVPGAVPEPELRGLGERLALARDGLVQSLIEDGAPRALLADEAELIPVVSGAVQRGGRYALRQAPDGQSFALVRLAEQPSEREVTLFGEPLRYRLIEHDDTLVVDYGAWAGRRLAGGGPPPAVWEGGGTVWVDRQALSRLGEEQFLPRVEALRARGREARDDAAFLALADPARLSELLLLTKEALRWRSLEQVWSLVQHRPREEQLARFVADQAARAELRAAADLRELWRLRPPETAEPAPLTGRERAALYELGALSAAIHGEPLGVLADVVGVVAASLERGAEDPLVAAARNLLPGFLLRCRPGEGGLTDDALAFARLARADPETLRGLAAALHAERLAELAR